VFDVGRTLHAERVVLFLAPGSSGVAVVASRRVGGAVERNRARRILREAWREVAPMVGDRNDVVIVAREAIRGAKTRDLVAEMTELLLLREPSVRS
jgi:ribonuclease P protein component